MATIPLYGALKHKYPNRNQITVKTDGDVETIIAWDVPDVPEPPPESEWASIKEEYALHLEATKYQRDREISYPSIQEQLDMQYWDAVNGTNKWQEAVAKVKTDNPKPE